MARISDTHQSSASPSRTARTGVSGAMRRPSDKGNWGKKGVKNFSHNKETSRKADGANKKKGAKIGIKTEAHARVPFNEEYLKITWDVIVIGGGPAGMMAAIGAGKRGKKVLIIEKNEKLGKKLLITGGGRCNVTNATFDTRELLKKYGAAEQFLFSPFSRFSTKDTIDFFTQRGVETKTEAERRVFPVTDKAETIWRALVQDIKALRIHVHSHVAVSGLYIERTDEGEMIKGVRVLSNGVSKKVLAHAVVLATGGLSHPETGSTGDGFTWLAQAGHTIITPTSSLVPLAIQDRWVKELQGVTLTDVKVTVLSSSGQSVKSGSTDGSKEGLTHGPSAKESATVQSQLTALKKEKSLTGKVLFTHFGVTGPTILNLSKTVSDALAYNDVYLSLDLKPSLDHGQLNTLLLTYIDSHKNKLLKNMLAEMLPVAIIKEVLTAAQIPLDIECHSLTRDMRMAIIQSIKGLTMKVKGLLGDDKAIVSSGGVTLAEIDTRTMCSRKIKQLYVVGDMLDIDRPSGGYSLQLCWTTGFVAGECV